MKESKVLKLLSYILIPIFIAIFIVSVVYTAYREEINNTNDSVSKENEFVSTFMYEVSMYAKALIHNNDNYTQLIDNGTNIFYYNRPNTTGIEDFYIYIKYKNIALTNVELTSDTNTIAGIREFINSQDAKKTNIIKGEVNSDTEVINKKAVQYFEDFNINYYYTENSYSNVVISEATDETEEYVVQTDYIETNIEDFDIYTSYKENIIKPVYENEINTLMEKIDPYSNLLFIAIPITAMGTVICAIYLCFSIGHTKNSDKIELNGFDKWYYEIVLIIAISLIVIMLIPFEEIGLGAYPPSEYSFNFIMSLIATCYFLSYIVFALVFNTTLKRIKAKQFWNTTITGKVIMWTYKKLVVLYKKLKNDFNKLKETVPRNKKLIIYIIAFVLVEILLLLIFNVFGFILDAVLAIYVFNKIMKYINSYEKIENKLKDMYEGDNKIELNEEDVEPEFRNTVKYIKDISNGFENAIEENMKSERLKTELITNVSHDIKTPLTSIINYVDLLKQENIENDKATEYIEILDAKSQRLKKLTEDLVEASKASSGAIRLNIEKININELFKQAIGEFEDKFKNKGLEIITNYSKNNIYIKADSRYMYRVIENLFSNVSKYALENSRVYIDVKSENNIVKIAIKNISKDKLNISADELMQRFVRGDKSRTTEGSGLGISIAKSLTEVQKGKFNLQIDGDLFKVEIEFEC